MYHLLKVLRFKLTSSRGFKKVRTFTSFNDLYAPKRFRDGHFLVIETINPLNLFSPKQYYRPHHILFHPSTISTETYTYIQKLIVTGGGCNHFVQDLSAQETLSFKYFTNDGTVRKFNNGIALDRAQYPGLPKSAFEIYPQHGTCLLLTDVLKNVPCSQY